MSSQEERIIALLGQGLGAETVASAVGVSPSYVSQILSNPVNSARVSELRYSNLIKHNETDDRYDKMEATLQDRLEKMIPMMFKPMEVLKSLQIINQAKRRGISSPEQIGGQQSIVNLTIPVQIINQVTTEKVELNVNNQVVKIGDQDMITVQSHKMESLLGQTKELKGTQNVLLESNPTETIEAHRISNRAEENSR